MENIELNNKRILVENIQENSIIIKVTVDEYQKARVINISDDCEEVKIGDYIVYYKTFGTNVKIDGKMFRILSEENITLIVDKDTIVK